ncbi:MAG: protein kinase [Elusimicrobiota bacterium]
MKHFPRRPGSACLPLIMLLLATAAAAAVDPTYQQFDRSVERYIDIEMRLADAEDELAATKGEARAERQVEIGRLRAELLQAERRAIKTAVIYLGDRAKGESQPRRFRDLAAELIKDSRQLLARGRLNDALYSAEKALAINPDIAGGFLTKAQILLELGNYRTAVEAAHEALRRDSGDRRAYKVIAGAQLRMGRLKQAADSAALLLTGRSLFDASGSVAWSLPSARSGEEAGGSPLPFVLGGLVVGIGGFLLTSFLWRRRAAAARPAPQPEAGAKKGAMGVDIGGEEYIAGKYECGDIIEYGSGSQLWHATDHSLERAVIIQKVLKESMAAPVKVSQAYVETAQRIAALSHPNIVDIYEVLDLPQGLFLVRESLRGRTAQELVKELGLIPPAQAFAIMDAVCAALGAAHQAGLYHGTLSPDNIHISSSGHVKLLDFGISRILNEFKANEYLPPEADVRKAGAVHDVYSASACTHFLFTGAPPDDDLKSENLPPGMGPLLAEAMEADPAARMKSLDVFAARLEALRPAA